MRTLAGVTGETKAWITPPVRTLVVAGADSYRRRFGFLRFGAYSGGFSWSAPTSEARHGRRLAILSLQLSTGVRNHAAGEKNDIAGERNDASKSHLADAVEYEDETAVEGVEEEVEKEIEDDGGVEAIAVYSTVAPRGTRKQCVGGAVSFRNPPLYLPKKQPLPWRSELLFVEDNKSGEEFSQSCRLRAPPFRRWGTSGAATCIDALGRSGGLLLA